MFKRQVLGYKRSTVRYYITELSNYIETLKMDIDYLKQENLEFKERVHSLYENFDALEVEEIREKLKELAL